MDFIKLESDDFMIDERKMVKELVEYQANMVKEGDLEECVINCIASGTYIYWDDFKDKRVPKHKVFLFEGGDFN